MSKTVEERVVSMQFDNKRFEYNVKTSLSTLEKLKNALNFTGAIKGVKELNNVSKNMNFSDMEIGATRAGFHISDVFEKVTRFIENNIARRIVNAGEKMVKEFTVEPIATGFNEYELKMGSVQTIMASTGESLATVNKYLEELNKYSDQTIYSFSDMTNNIGKFTNAGVKLEDAVAAIKGVSNEAAVSGANAQEASRAMYNFAQALSAGYVKLIDWKSIENANMATVEFKNELIKTGVELGTLTKQGDQYISVTKDMNGKVSAAFDATHNFNDALSHQWMTSEVLTKTLAKYSDETTEIGKKAYAAAQDVKTFSMMMDTLKEAAQSGWAQSWELIAGDFEEAKKLWTGLSEEFSEMIEKSADKRNGILAGALESNFERYIRKINDAKISTDEYSESIKKVLSQKYGNTLKGDFDTIIKSCGSLENAVQQGAISISDLKKALYGIEKVNLRGLKEGLKLGSSGEDVKKVQKALSLLGYEIENIDGKFDETTESALKLFQAENKLGETGIIDENTLKSLTEASDRTKDLRKELDSLLSEGAKKGGRNLAIEGIFSLLDSIKKVSEVFGKAYESVFDGDKSKFLYDLIDGFNNLTKAIKPNAETLEKLSTIFKGVFSILDIAAKVLTGFVKGLSVGIAPVINAILSFLSALGELAIKLDSIVDYKAMFENLGKVIGNVFSFIGNAISSVFGNTDKVTTAISNMVKGLLNAANGFGNFGLSISDALANKEEYFKKFVDGFKNLITNVSNLFSNFFGKVGNDTNSLSNNLKDTFNNFRDLGSNLNDRLNEILDFVSKIKDAFSEGGISSALEEFKNKFKSMGDGAGEASKSINEQLDKIEGVINSFSEWVKNNVTLEDVIKTLFSGALLAYINRVRKMVKDFSGVLNEVSDAIKKFSGGGDKKKQNAQKQNTSIFDMLGLTDFVKMGKSLVKSFGEILTELKKTIVTFQNGLKVTTLVLVAVAINLLVTALTKLASLSLPDLGKSILAIGSLLVMLSLTLKSMTKTLSSYNSKGMVKAGVGLILIAIAIGILADALIKIGALPLSDIIKGLIGVGGSLLILSYALKIIGKNSKAIPIRTSIAMVALAASCIILAKAMKLFSEMSWAEIGKGLVGMGGALAELAIALLVIGKIGGNKSLIGAVALLIAVQSLDEIADALTRLGMLNWSQIGIGLTAMGVALTELLGAILIIGKVGKINGLLGAVTLLIAVQSLDEIADALLKLGSLTWPRIGRGLTAMGVALTELMGIILLIGKVGKIKGLLGAVTLLIAVQSLDEIADALVKLGALSWSQVGSGLSAIGGVLAELAIVLILIGRLGGPGGMNALNAAQTLYLAVKALDEIADALLRLGTLSWSQVGRGLTAMGGALAELAIVLILLGKLGGFGSLIGAVTLIVAVKALDDIAMALLKLGMLSWSQVGRGLTAMGGALAELAIVLILLGRLGGMSGLVGAVALVVAVKALDDIAMALLKLGMLSWSQVGRGLTAMGGALTELIASVMILGKIGGLGALLGAAVITIVTKDLPEIADALAKFGSMEWDEIGHGLTAMGGALAVIGAGSFFAGLSGIPGLLGAKTISIITEDLPTIADSLLKFASMSWDEIQNGLNAMDQAFSALSLGGLENTFSFLGAFSISKLTKPLGELADAMIKWNNVEIPKGLGWKLSEIAFGILPFTFTTLSGLSIAILAKDLGVLADSVKKWKDVIVPENIGDQLKLLADGVKAFGLGNVIDGAGLSSIAEPLGKLASSVQKWKDVVVPDNLEENLKSLANGVKEFGFDNTIDGKGMQALIEPLSKLPTAIRKWNGVTISTELTDGLERLAKSIKSFTFGFMSGYSIGTLIDPLTKLPEAVKKWNGITIPQEATDGLERLAKSIKGFTFGFMSGFSISTIIDPLTRLPDAFVKWKDVEIGENVTDGLARLAEAVKAFSFSGFGANSMKDIVEPLLGMGEAAEMWTEIKIPDNLSEDLKSFWESIKTIILNFKDIKGIDFESINGFSTAIDTLIVTIDKIKEVDSNAITSFVNAVNEIGNVKINPSTIVDTSSKLSSAVASLIQAIKTSINSSKPSIEESMKNVMSGLVMAIRTSNNSVTTNIVELLSKANRTIASKKETFSNTVKNIMSSIVETIRSYSDKVADACKTVMTSGINAIRSKKEDFKQAGKYVTEGLVQGIKANEESAYNAGYALGQKAVEGEKAGQQSHSPSKATIQAGNWLGEGLIIGMEQMGSAVYNSGKTMGSYAVDSIRNALSSIGDTSKSDFGIEPHIRPVVDTSNIRMAKLDLSTSIDTYMSRPINSLSNIIADAQDRINTSNRDMVNAINGLRDDMDSLYTMINEKDSNLYVDSRQLASSIAKPMNRELSVLARKGAY